MGPAAPVGERDGRGAQRLDDAGLYGWTALRVETLPAGQGYDGPVEALWLLLVPVVLIGGFFLIRSFVRLSRSIVALRAAMTELSDAGIALNKVQQEVARLGESVDEVRRR